MRPDLSHRFFGTPRTGDFAGTSPGCTAGLRFVAPPRPPATGPLKRVSKRSGRQSPNPWRRLRAYGYTAENIGLLAPSPGRAGCRKQRRGGTTGLHWRRIRPKNQRSHRRRKGRTSFGPQLVKRVAKLLFQALPGGRASVLCEIAGLFAGGSAVFEATSPIMTVFYCFPAATGTLRGLLPRKVFCQADGRGVSLPARRTSNFQFEPRPFRLWQNRRILRFLRQDVDKINRLPEE